MMVRAWGRSLKLLDFGVAKLVEPDAQSRGTELTQFANVCA
jgi:hypothetical protein